MALQQHTSPDGRALEYLNLPMLRVSSLNGSIYTIPVEVSNIIISFIVIYAVFSDHKQWKARHMVLWLCMLARLGGH
jgi:hypothetical protein